MYRRKNAFSVEKWLILLDKRKKQTYNIGNILSYTEVFMGRPMAEICQTSYEKTVS